MPDVNALAQRMKEKAELVSAVVTPVASLDEALAYVADVCEKKEACQILASGCAAPLSPPAEALCETKQEKIIAAPGLPAAAVKKLAALCKDKGIRVIKDNLRGYLGGIDIAFTEVQAGIAETGTLVLASNDEDLRLATMVSETHIALLPVSKIKADSYDLEEELTAWMRTPPNYTAFITGASRTADIERVLALGVHGPLELHILLWEGK